MAIDVFESHERPCASLESDVLRPQLPTLSWAEPRQDVFFPSLQDVPHDCGSHRVPWSSCSEKEMELPAEKEKVRLVALALDSCCVVTPQVPVPVELVAYTLEKPSFR